MAEEPADETITPQQVRDALQNRALENREIAYLETVIDTRTKLNRTLESLRSATHEQLRAYARRTTHSSSSEQRVELVLIGQAIAGTDAINPTLEPYRVPIYGCGDRLSSVIEEVMPTHDGTLSLEVSLDCGISLMLTQPTGYRKLLQTFKPQTPQDKQFWLIVARKIVQKELRGETPHRALATSRNIGAWLELASELSLPELIWDVNSVRIQSLFSSVKSVLAPDSDSDIDLVNSLGVVPPRPGGRLRVLYNSRPAANMQRNMPSGLGMPLFAANGTVTGELIGNDIYIYADSEAALGQQQNLANSQMLATLLSARDELRLRRDRQASAASVQALPTASAEETALFLTTCYDAIKDSEQSRRSELATLDRRLGDLTRIWHETDMNEKSLGNSLEATLIREFDDQAASILANQNVTSLKIISDNLVIETRTLYCVDERSNRRHEIGRMKIVIGIAGRLAGQIQFFNLTRQVNGFQHPHVDNSGRPCLGNISGVIPELVSKRDFVSAVGVAIAYVESANTQDTLGKRISNWPLAGR